MYYTFFKNQIDALNLSESRIFIPALCAYEIHLLKMEIVGGITQIEGTDYIIDPPFLNLDKELNDMIGKDGNIYINVSYYNKKNINDPVVQKFAKTVISKTVNKNPSTEELKLLLIRQNIFISHFINAHFAFDNGLYKEAVVNMGVVLESLLNTELKKGSLYNLIENPEIISKYKDLMHGLREARNKVHPNNLADFEEINRQSAIKCRDDMEQIITELYNK